MVPATLESPASGQGEEGLSLSLNTELPVETVQQFESLEEFAKSSTAIPDSSEPVQTETALPEPIRLDSVPETPALTGENIDPATSGGFGVPDYKPETPTYAVSSSDSPPPTPNQAAQEVMENVRKFSETAEPAPAVPAAYPFSLTINGPLAPEEKERLLDLLSRENMGIREVDLEPQFEAGRILIPRISEYAGVLLVQALRGTQARMRLYPSDSQEDFHETSVVNAEPSGPHPAESLPITQAGAFPQFSQTRTIETVTASAALNVRAVEAQETPEFQDALESLKRELRYRAFRKGACGIIGFNFTLTTLNLPTRYRLTVSGDAVSLNTPSSS